ncbi:MAG: ImmA/IrrE family metallo-endopeptidase [Pseudomonadota bacterium]|nr:ImmA/IrrE family metallo-endopeptidase [Pseudomonadota bacterium]
MEQFASLSELEINFINELITGGAAVDAECATILEEHLGPSAEFWMAREQQYRNSLSRKAMANTVVSDKEFVGRFPVTDMKKCGWIANTATLTEKMKSVLDFFGVNSVSEWQAKFGNAVSVAAFRTSPTIEANPFAVAAWLRRGEREGEKIACSQWNKISLKNKITDMRALVRVKDPAIFFPKLVEMCASCGVALVIARAPKGCRASGATRFLTPNKALIVMSFRHRTDDQFWFTFFHEIAHLVLHTGDALFLEDGSEVTEDEEIEANQFAASILIPDVLRDELASVKCSVKGIVAYTRKVGLTPGIVVGQLQHIGRIKYDRFNSMKRRYSWDHAGTPKLIP